MLGHPRGPQVVSRALCGGGRRVKESHPGGAAPLALKVEEGPRGASSLQKLERPGDSLLQPPEGAAPRMLRRQHCCLQDHNVINVRLFKARG